ncbi:MULTISPECIES: ATP-binding protein [unclassified Streptomyces]|uniref:ATP-binding protein n=1 Tax=unclassified Streptomyces TaxID=2593676 RepID=UPI0023667611|nr:MULTISPECIES: ATP-binding protein [unclassified Streptomyces]MDF3141575.1 ATP-binding protein [Streptomyces sp. T21Q-yed]WDF38986.1 ATP-binding protein [Streptomyces sp. T12]
MSPNSLPQVTSSTHQFAVQLSATRRGARLARLLAERQLVDWGRTVEGGTHVVAELASNAVLHGRVPGRDFRLRLKLHADRTLRIEVTDARGDRIPQVRDAVGADADSGRGLLIVAAYADRWGVDEAPANCKTVWAELAPDRGES